MYQVGHFMSFLPFKWMISFSALTYFIGKIGAQVWVVPITVIKINVLFPYIRIHLCMFSQSLYNVIWERIFQWGCSSTFWRTSVTPKTAEINRWTGFCGIFRRFHSCAFGLTVTLVSLTRLIALLVCVSFFFKFCLKNMVFMFVGHTLLHLNWVY